MSFPKQIAASLALAGSGALVLLTLHACENGTRPTVAGDDPPDSPSPTLAITDPTVGGRWAAASGWPPHVAIHAHLLPDGRVLFWPGEEGPHRGTKGYQFAFIWNPANGTSVQVDNRWTDVFCSGHAFLSDGRLLVTGGHITDGVGRREAAIFDFSRRKWSRAPAMRAGRWYPTNTTLPNGEVLTIAGTISATQNNTIPEVWTGSGWRALTGANLGLPYYPRMFVAPNGKVFNAGDLQATRYLSTAGTGSWQFVANSNYGRRDYGSAVMYTPGKVLILGGSRNTDGEPPTNTAELIDLNQGAPAWQYTGAMTFGRRQLNATILADGRVLATGGSSGAGFSNESASVFAAELWDPTTGVWSPMASMTTPRLYHSTALLLPDGRVLSAGGGRCAGCTTDRTNAEIYSPPYLFKGARPSITGAPTTVGYNQGFTIQTPAAASITKVTWIRLSSVTHAFDMNQRFSSLPIVSRTSVSLNVTSPGNSNLAPPGHYLLFILNSNGVPSVAKIVRIS
jgi:hypothetical protein